MRMAAANTGIETLNMPIHGNSNHLIDLFFDVARDAFSFISDDEGDFPFCIPFVARGTVHICSEGPEAFILEFIQSLTEVGHSSNRYVLNSPSSRFGNNRSYTDSAVLGIMTPETLVASGSSQDRPQIMRIS